MRVCVIGAGASGLMAAITAARKGAEVTVLEQNDKPGRKLLATGNGKCNLTNLDPDFSCYESSDPGRTQEILRLFPPEETLSFFHSLGLRTIDRNGWVYPATEQASQVLELLLMEASARHVRIKTNEKVIAVKRKASPSGEKITPSAGKAVPPAGKAVFSIKTNSWQYEADRVIIATGSPASAVRGSSEDALAFAGSFHIRYQTFIPSLVPLKAEGNRFAKWGGTRVRGTVTILAGGKKIASDTGELQLTEYGISGIPVFQVSRYAVRAMVRGRSVREDTAGGFAGTGSSSAGSTGVTGSVGTGGAGAGSSGAGPVEAELDFMPDMSEEELFMELMGRIRSFHARTFAGMLVGLLPDRLIPLIIEEIRKHEEDGFPWKNATGKAFTELAPAILAEKLRTAAGVICHFRIPIRGAASLKQAQISAGGVDMRELAFTLEAKKVPGLFFCGEAADTDGPCGGYNLQWAWASGYVAGLGAARIKNK